MMTMATTEALYGSKNPSRGNPSLLKEIWYVVPYTTAHKDFG